MTDCFGFFSLPRDLCQLVSKKSFHEKQKDYLDEYSSKLHPLLKVVGVKHKLPGHHYDLIRSDFIRRNLCHSREYGYETIKNELIIMLLKGITHPRKVLVCPEMLELSRDTVMRNDSIIGADSNLS